MCSVMVVAASSVTLTTPQNPSVFVTQIKKSLVLDVQTFDLFWHILQMLDPYWDLKNVKAGSLP